MKHSAGFQSTAAGAFAQLPCLWLEVCEELSHGCHTLLGVAERGRQPICQSHIERSLVTCSGCTPVRSKDVHPTAWLGLKNSVLSEKKRGEKKEPE